MSPQRSGICSWKSLMAFVRTQLSLFVDFNQIRLDNPKALKDSLKKMNSLFQRAWMEREDLALHKGLIHVVSALETGEAFWKQVIGGQSQKAEAFITQLGELVHLFTKSCFTVPKAHVIFPEKVYIFHKILYIQQLLCRLGYPNSPWKKIDLELHGIYSEAKFLCFPEAKMHREMNALSSRRVFMDSDDIRIHRNSLLGFNLAV
jgi:hypothetical protein